MRVDLDLGHNHTLQFYSFAPDRVLNPQYTDLPDIEKHGAIITHRKVDGSPCSGNITFDDVVSQRLDPPHPRWTVVNWEPLTLVPSILCRACGDHGWIRNGVWVPA